MKRIAITLDNPTHASVVTAFAATSCTGYTGVRLEIFEYRKRVSKNIVFLKGNLLADGEDWYANSLLGLYKYYPPQIVRLVIHVYYQD